MQHPPRGSQRNRADVTTDEGSSVVITPDQSLEMPATAEFGREMAEEAFMAEPVTVMLADTTDDNAPTHALFSVNGVTQPLLRGMPTIIKRKFVEALARCKETKYNQRHSNPMEPDRIEMVSRTALAFPFQVIEDKNPKGRAWLSAVLAEPA